MTRESMTTNDWYVDKRLQDEIKNWLTVNASKTYVKRYRADLEACKLEISGGGRSSSAGDDGDNEGSPTFINGSRRMRRMRRQRNNNSASNQRAVFHKLVFSLALIVGLTACYFFLSNIGQSPNYFTSS